MTSLNVRVSLSLDIAPESLADFQSLDPGVQQRLRNALWQRLFGAQANDVALLSRQAGGTWQPTLEMAEDTGLLAHDTIHQVALAALENLNALALPYQFTLAGAHGSTLEVTADADTTLATGTMHAGDDDDSMPPYHCVRWVLIDGQFVPIYNYLVSLTDEQDVESTEIVLKDGSRSAAPIKARLHVAVEHSVPVA